jgi:uncharacterized DUF497 family protein
MVKLAGFDWDAGNRRKCRKHGVSLAEIEEVFRGAPAVFPDPAHSQRERRMRAIGPTQRGHYVFVAFTLRTDALGHTRIRPISARYMHAKEIRHYVRQQEES